jgi:glutamate synthase (NADPH/NADH) small chain
MELGEPDDSGRRRPIAIEGLGISHGHRPGHRGRGLRRQPPADPVHPGHGIEQWGYIVADPETGKTTKKGVWAGGDIVTGAATVILAMGAGRKAADSIDQYLSWGW